MLASTREYAIAMNVPEETVDTMMRTPSYESEQVFGSDVSKLIPYLDELIAATYGAMTREDQGALAVAGGRIDQDRATEEDRAVYSRLKPIKRQLMECTMWRHTAFRMEAFNKYFGRDYFSDIQIGNLKRAAQRSSLN